MNLRRAMPAMPIDPYCHFIFDYGNAAAKVKVQSVYRDVCQFVPVNS